MNFRRIALISTTMFLSLVSLSGSALAFCGVLQASASGYSRDEALSKANNKGLVEVRRLEANYGSGAVHYQPARSSCQEGGRVSCFISQKFCVDSGQRQRPGRGEEGHSMHGCPPGTRPFRKRIIACLYVNERGNLKASRGKSRVAGPGNRAATGATPGPAEDMNRPARSIDARTLRDACAAGVSDRRLADQYGRSGVHSAVVHRGL